MSVTTTEAAPAAGSAVADRSAGRDAARLRAARVALPVLLVAFVAFFSFAKPETFFTLSNFQAIVGQQAVLGILAVALVLPLVIGEFDLSVGANLGLGAIIVAGLPAKSGVPLVPAVLAALAICTLVGAINGMLVARGGINSLVATLGTSTVITGAVGWYTGGAVLDKDFPEQLSTVSQQNVAGVPLAGVYLLVVAVVAWFVLEHTPVGRRLYALGGSKEASRMSGLRVERLTFGAFTASGLLCGVAGVLQAGMLGAGNPTVGPPSLLPAFAAVFLGATTIRVGVFNVVGTIVAVFTIAVGITGLQLMGVAFFVAPVFQGLALLVAVGAVRMLRRESI